MAWEVVARIEPNEGSDGQEVNLYITNMSTVTAIYNQLRLVTYNRDVGFKALLDVLPVKLSTSSSNPQD